MNDKALPPELRREAAQARVRAAKDQLSRAAVGAIYGARNAIAEADAALRELEAARAELRSIDDTEETSQC